MVAEADSANRTFVREKNNAGFYWIRFRKNGQMFTASSSFMGIVAREIVMVKVDQGLEPAVICGTLSLPTRDDGQLALGSYEIARQATEEEISKYEELPAFEARAFRICGSLITKHRLDMRLIRVERFFNGSKMIFYFTAENRVDFRALVKDLVQEFRTRVEMRQVGVRHETRMIGGLGICGRELCCSSFLKKFDSVSIKMAKEQDLPLNPSKISGLCNRLLCCLTYEYDLYRQQRKGMPKPGRKVRIDKEVYTIKRQNPLQRTVLAMSSAGEEKLLDYAQWRSAEIVRADKGGKRKKDRK